MFESCQGPQRGNDAVAIYIWVRTAADKPSRVRKPHQSHSQVESILGA